MDAPQTVISIPQGVYPVTYRGDLVAGEFVTVPRLHQRAGDRVKNPLVYAIIQNCSGFTDDFPEVSGLAADSSLLWWQWPRVKVHDESNDFCNVIVWPNAFKYDTDRDVKISASGFTYSPGALFTVAAFYKMPE